MTVNPGARSDEEPPAVHPTYGLGGQPLAIPYGEEGTAT